ncbi:tryptophan synthase subunit alpha [Saccharomonospora piscinae]|uniref:tryptophan synthase subunit alpha n=1 Tax=Saccharomonospora piscinae TaxID=687388 RepID=UPI0011072E11|nr:tryptophan synthase subunit alpha [Saccharomonospora piscinae]TLW92176.1 tryptophan synthase subunit alpha [Saccharomonospora piscinae]
MSTLGLLFETTRQQRRAALVAYLPAGYPTVAASKTLLGATIDAGADLVEIGVPYSDPVMDGPTIQGAADAALRNGFRLKHLFEVVESVAARGGRAVVMTYYNPVYHYGVDAFARDLASAGGLGLITPDLTPDEGGEWLTAASEHGLDRIFLVAPSSSDERIALTTKATTGFVYATAVMGVTGARESVGTNAAELVRRTRQHTDLPVGVGLGVRSADQAAEVAGFADAVIVGSALVAKAGDGPDALGSLTAELAEGVRRPQH